MGLMEKNTSIINILKLLILLLKFNILYIFIIYYNFLQAMLWKKNSTNYSKWDYFTSSSES